MAAEKLRVLQIGAGSMGTRRLRDLSPRAEVVLGVCDSREDRRERARQRFPISSFASLEAALDWQPHALVISAPPDEHQQYVDLALERRLHHFCEAHIWTPDYRAIEAAEQEHGLVCASSNSMCFLPVVRKLRELVNQRLGVLHLYQVFLSTWLPSWHPSEPGAFYAWRRPTAAAREMVPFELLYLNDIFGLPSAVAGSVSRRGQLEVEGEDTWCLQMNLAGGAHGQLGVLMGSPAHLRHGFCFGSGGGLLFDIMSGQITFQPEAGEPQHFTCGSQKDTVEARMPRRSTRFWKPYWEAPRGHTRIVPAAPPRQRWPPPKPAPEAVVGNRWTPWCSLRKRQPPDRNRSRYHQKRF